mmetsp:Transcript_10350/g.12467  ORF Transcript_10350/g.12467 Transcript_10350/m.12467 type:complete len:365 (+) Transcript_10350:53-1147(+)
MNEVEDANEAGNGPIPRGSISLGSPDLAVADHYGEDDFDYGVERETAGGELRECFCQNCLCIVLVFIFLLGFYSLFILPFSIPFFLEAELGCKDFVPSNGVMLGQRLESYQVARYTSLSELANTFTGINYKATLKNEQQEVVGIIEADENYIYSDLCSPNGVCITTTERYSINQVDLNEPLYVYPFEIKVTKNDSIVGEIRFGTRGAFSANKYEPKIAMFYKDALVEFKTKNSKSYRQRINFDYGLAQGSGKRTLWPGASIIVSDDNNKDSRYCVPQVLEYQPLNWTLFNDTNAPGLEVIEAVMLRGDTAAQLQFLTRITNLISDGGNIKKNRFVFGMTLSSFILFCCCAIGCNYSRIGQALRD